MHYILSSAEHMLTIRAAPNAPLPHLPALHQSAVGDANVTPFPSAFERDQFAFDRTGTSPLVSAIDEGHWLFEATRAEMLTPAFATRLEDFAKAVDELTRNRPESVHDELDLRGCTFRVPLSMMPAFLRATVANIRRAPTLYRVA
jgi:hypothetical protein